jgi:gas vesicle protein GvpG
MGLITGLLTLPLAPVRGTVWVAEQLKAEAERQVREQQSPRRRLLEAERQLELGLLTLDEYEVIEEEALDALEQDEEGRWRT